MCERGAPIFHKHGLARALHLLSFPADSLIRAPAPEPSGGSSASAACPAAAQRCRSRLTEPLRQLAPRYRRPHPTLGHCGGRAERRARRCSAGSGFYSASGTTSPIYGRHEELLKNIIAPCITPYSRFMTRQRIHDDRRLGLTACCCRKRCCCCCCFPTGVPCRYLEYV
jgi:hypothetical protein